MKTNPAHARAELNSGCEDKPRYRKGAQSAPTGMDEGSRSNAQYRGAEVNLCPDAWGTEAQGTHDNTYTGAGRQCRA